MKSYYDSGHLCRISYHPRPRIDLRWLIVVRRAVDIQSVATLVDGDIDIGTAYFISDSSLALSIDSLARMVRWMGRVESSSRPELSDQEE